MLVVLVAVALAGIGSRVSGNFTVPPPPPDGCLDALSPSLVTLPPAAPPSLAAQSVSRSPLSRIP